MKIITKNAVYVQKGDLEFFKYSLHTLPQSISSKIFENSEIDIDEFNKYDFFKFEELSEITFFKNIDWIINYDSVKNLTSTEIKKIGSSYVEKLEQITRRLYATNPDDKEYEDILLQYKLLNYQIDSLGDIIDFKSGLLKMNLPDGKNHFHYLIKKIFSKKNQSEI